MMKGKDLEIMLQQAQKGFAYELLALQIEIDDENTSNSSILKIQNITRLIQMYMAAVEALQSKADKRYKYFNNKIQNLMKKKHIVEQLHVASTGRPADYSALQQVLRAEIGDRKNQLDLQIFLNKQQFDAKKIRQMMKNAQSKLKNFQSHISKNIKKQDEALQERKRIRKMKSQSGSVTKFDMDNRFFQSPNRRKPIKTDQQLDDYFAIGSPRPRKRSGSIQKIDNKIKSNNSKIKELLV